MEGERERDRKGVVSVVREEGEGGRKGEREIGRESVSVCQRGRVGGSGTCYEPLFLSL
jgi:hypothetical protein